MADPPDASPSAPAPGNDNVDRDLDADMQDTQDDSATHLQEASSSTMDHELQHGDSQPTTSFSHQNRKDTTLREFLSKMDDYAPIV